MSIRTSSTCPWLKTGTGPDGIVVSKLRNDGWSNSSPGFLTTAQCESKITYIDGKHSILRYCGYPIRQLCENSDFLEVAWLLRHGRLPSRAEYEQFCADSILKDDGWRRLHVPSWGSFPRSAHPMSVLASAINALATFYPDTTDISDNDQYDEAAKIIMAKARTIVSYIFRRRDEPMLYPDYARGYVDDFLHCASLCRTSRLNQPAQYCMLWVVC